MEKRIDVDVCAREYKELPEAFVTRMREMLDPEEYPAFIESFSQSSLRGLRFNPLKISAEKIAQIEN